MRNIISLDDHRCAGGIRYRSPCGPMRFLSFCPVGIAKMHSASPLAAARSCFARTDRRVSPLANAMTILLLAPSRHNRPTPLLSRAYCPVQIVAGACCWHSQLFNWTDLPRFQVQQVRLITASPSRSSKQRSVAAPHALPIGLSHRRHMRVLDSS